MIKEYKQILIKPRGVWNNKPFGDWTKFTGQKLEKCDLLWTNKGLAFVDSSFSDGTPNRISSMPESWTCEMDDCINKRSNDEGLTYISKNGWVYANYRYLGKSIKTDIKILFVSKISSNIK